MCNDFSVRILLNFLCGRFAQTALVSPAPRTLRWRRGNEYAYDQIFHVWQEDFGSRAGDPKEGGRGLCGCYANFDSLKRVCCWKQAFKGLDYFLYTGFLLWKRLTSYSFWINMCGILKFLVFTLTVLLSVSVDTPIGFTSNIGEISRAVQYHEESFSTEGFLLGNCICFYLFCCLLKVSEKQAKAFFLLCICRTNLRLFISERPPSKHHIKW